MIISVVCYEEILQNIIEVLGESLRSFTRGISLYRITVTIINRNLFLLTYITGFTLEMLILGNYMC
jgi:hypothetical protein